MTTTPTPNPIETHDTHSKRLIEHAQEQLEKGDRLQASEKAWGAVAHKAKVIADRMGWTYDTHTDFHGLKNRIAKLTDDPKTTRRLLSIALHLHTNYYRDQYPLEDIRADLEEVKTLLDILDGPEFMQPVERKPRNTRPSTLGGGNAKELGGQGRLMGEEPKGRKRQASAYGGKKTTQKMLDTGKR